MACIKCSSNGTLEIKALKQPFASTNYNSPGGERFNVSLLEKVPEKEEPRSSALVRRGQRSWEGPGEKLSKRDSIQDHSFSASAGG